MKEAWKIQSYFDFVDIANEFFIFYEEIQEKEEQLEKMIRPWQKEKYSFFKCLKENLNIREEKYLPKEFTWTLNNYHPEHLKHFSKVVFFDIPSFPNVFRKTLPFLQENFDLEFVLQISKEDFDEENLKLRQVSPSLLKGEFFCYELKSQREEALFLLAQKEKEDFSVYSNSSYEKNFSRLFPKFFTDST